MFTKYTANYHEVHTKFWSAHAITSKVLVLTLNMPNAHITHTYFSSSTHIILTKYPPNTLLTTNAHSVHI